MTSAEGRMLVRLVKLHADRFPTPVGDVALAVDESGALVRVRFLGSEATPDREEGGADLVWEPGSCAAARAQLEEYFRGERRAFELELAPVGTAFQRRVWNALRRIPYGRIASYGEIARELGMPGASRAVGQANNRNPLPIVVPCHRVIGADKSVTGFGGGIAIKRALLDFERGQPSLFPA